MSALTFHRPITFEDDTTCSSNLGVVGNVDICGTLVVGGQQINGSQWQDAEGGISYTGNVDVNGNLNFTGELLQDGQPFQGSQWNDNDGGINYNGNVDVSGAFQVTKPISVGSLLAYYRFEDDATDDLNNYNLTVTGAPTYTTGKIGRAISFNNPDSQQATAYLTNTAIAPILQSPPLTISTWIQATSLTGFFVLFYLGNTFPDGININLYQGMLQCGISVAGESNPTYLTNYNQISTNTWIHVAVTYDGTVCKYYQNGSLVGSANKSGNLGTTNFLRIAGSDFTGWNGLIDDFRVYDAALTQSDITNIYNSTTPIAIPSRKVIFADVSGVAINKDVAEYELDVDGDIHASGSAIIEGDIHASGSAIIEGDINYTGQLLQNGQPFQGSQWDDISNGISYDGRVAIGKTTAAYSLDVSGSFNVTADANFKKGNNASSGWTHFPATDGVNYIRGETRICDNGGSVFIGSVGQGVNVNDTLSFNRSLAPANPWTTIQPADSRILFYSGGGSNWSGMGCDDGGRWWLRAGTSSQNILTMNAAGDVGVGTASPNKKLTVAGSMEVGLHSGDYQHIRIGGGNSSGYIYGAFNKLADGIHIGYNYYTDNVSDFIPVTAGGTSRISVGYGDVKIATGGPNVIPSERMIITSDGNVGIGASPSTMLDVSGTITLRNHANSDGRKTTRYLRTFDLGSTTAIAQIGLVGTGTSGYNGAITFETKGNADAYNDSITEKMRITSSGNVGIGITAPNNKLQIGGETAQYPTSVQINATGHATSRRAAIALDNWELMQDIHGNGTKNFSIYDRTNLSHRVNITTNGDVGIGNIAPQMSLDVTGSIQTRNSTVYWTAPSANWFNLGLWVGDGGGVNNSGQRLRLELIGCANYGNNGNEEAGVTIIYATIGNNGSTATANAFGSFRHDGTGSPCISACKFVQNGSNRNQYYVYANVNTYTQHALKVDCTQGSYFTPQFTQVSDPGANSSTVRAAVQAGTICRAFVCCDTNGTIRRSYNVSSTTRSSYSNFGATFVVNFTTAMPDTGYAVVPGSGGITNYTDPIAYDAGGKTTTSCMVGYGGLINNWTGSYRETSVSIFY